MNIMAYVIIFLSIFMSIGIGLVSCDLKEGGVWRATSFHMPPIMTMNYDEEGNMKLGGVALKNLEMLISSFGNKIEYIPLNGTGAELVGYYDVMIQQLINKGHIEEVDIVPFYFSVTSHWKIVDFLLSSAYAFPDAILVRIPEAQKTNLLGIVNPFDYLVWLMLLLSIIVFNLVKTLLSNHDGKMALSNDRRRRGTGHWRLLRFRFVLMGPWVLMMAILTLSYTATLESHLTVTQLKPIPNSVKDLVTNLRENPLLVIRQMDLPFRILEAKSGLLKILGDHLRAKPENVLDEMKPDEILKHVLNGGSFVGSKLVIRWLIEQDIKRSGGKCRLMMSNEMSTSKRLSMALAKNSPHTDALSIRTLRFVSHGFTYDYYVKDVAKIDQCRSPKKTSDPNHKWKLQDLVSAFIVLAVGVIVSSFCFLLEKVALISRWNR